MMSSSRHLQPRVSRKGEGEEGKGREGGEREGAEGGREGGAPWGILGPCLRSSSGRAGASEQDTQCQSRTSHHERG